MGAGCSTSNSGRVNHTINNDDDNSQLIDSNRQNRMCLTPVQEEPKPTINTNNTTSEIEPVDTNDTITSFASVAIVASVATVVEIDQQSITTNDTIDTINGQIIENTEVTMDNNEIDTKINIESIASNKNTVENILKWKASTPIFRYHWWPMKETATHSVYNNLYADDGGLDKYDTLMGVKSNEYQKNNYFKPTDSCELDANWAGFCDKATILSCLYEYPKHPVKVINKSKNSEIEFSVFNIEALMIIACDNAIRNNRFIFLGERNNSNHPTKNNKSEPLPSDLLDMLKVLSYSNTAFAMDIDSGSAVWNYSYDSLNVNKHTKCHLPHEKPETGHTVYLHFMIQSTAYPEKNQDLWGYVNTKHPTSFYDFPTVKNEGWITKEHPDFVWKHYAKSGPWEGKCCINPNVDANIIYKIYQKSMTDSAILEL
jgi:hypothetical protein